MNRTVIALLLVVLVANLEGQKSGARAARIYTSPDGAFEFKYPGNMVLKRGPTGANCQSSLVCVEWDPDDEYESSTFAGAGFWVSNPSRGETGGEPISENECLRFRDYPSDRPSSVVIDGRWFAVLDRGGAAAGTTSSIRLYRISHEGKCYELGTAISVAGGGYSEDDYAAGRAKRFTRKDYAKVEKILERIVKSFQFMK